jgi:hypothetical protein
MIARKAVAICAILLCGATTLGAQRKPEFLFGTGFQNRFTTNLDLGIHMFAAADFGRIKTLHPRLDVLFARSREMNLVTQASVVYAPVRRTVAPYLVAGGGLSFNNGMFPVGSVGAGLEISSLRAPIVLEGRAAGGPGGANILFTIAVRP